MIKDDNAPPDALAIVEKYEVFVKYLYPILQNSPRRHGVFRDTVLAALLLPIGGLYHAAKSKQVSRLYAVDAEFATLRAYMRFMAAPKIRMMSPHQHETALRLLAEPGGMLGAWIRRLSAGRQGSGAPLLRPEGQAGK
ncbi:MAG: diversity-generating retroelement protein Avd [Afipia sp.]|nr:diversity-generating retroelement protein Avd [Afipia sp.]OJW65498.1 MAG: hypothetical protein BGO65_12285 [Afipia sp. 64-13]